MRAELKGYSQQFTSLHSNILRFPALHDSLKLYDKIRYGVRHYKL